MGYPRASVMHGGLDAWIDLELPTTRSATAPTLQNFPINSDLADIIVDTQGMLLALRGAGDAHIGENAMSPHGAVSRDPADRHPYGGAGICLGLLPRALSRAALHQHHPQHRCGPKGVGVDLSERTGLDLNLGGDTDPDHEQRLQTDGLDRG